MPDAPTEHHRQAWLKMMKRLQADMIMTAKYSRLAIRDRELAEPDVEHAGIPDEAYYAARAWAADQLLAALEEIPAPTLPAPTYATPRESDARWLGQGPVEGLPTVVVGGISFHRKVCDAGMDGECYGVGCPQRDPSTRQSFCPLPTGNPWVALRESDSG